jgi:fluoride ion exporter CrcB/FEX
VFGICGEYLRYRLSTLNTLFPSFPLGTFLANVIGTWIATIIVSLSKYVVEYYDTSSQAVLYGLLTGFCGGLTTVSTLVKELDILPPTEAYAYTLATHSLSQVGIILLLNIYTFTTVPSSAIMPPPINMCHASAHLCDTFLSMIDCPLEDQSNTGCGHLPLSSTSSGDYSEFHGLCSCGQFSTDRINLILVDSQIKSNITKSMVTVWPTKPSQSSEPTEVFDLCMTYENVCLHFFDRIDCPASLRKMRSCDKQYDHPSSSAL